MNYHSNNSYLPSIILLVICGLVTFANSQECIRAAPDIAYVTRERTFLMIKPDGVQRGLVGEIIKRFEQKGLKLIALKLKWADSDTVKEHYQEHEGKDFFTNLIEYIGSGPVVPMVWEGRNAVKVARTILGSTKPVESAPGTVRGDLAMDTGRNLLHASDSVESANREIAVWFTDDELVKWGRNSDFWVYED